VTGQNSQRNRSEEWASRQTSCPSGKWTYPTRSAAKKHASRMRRMKGDNMRPYECLACGFWHVGHKPKITMSGAMSSSEFHARNIAGAERRRAERAARRPPEAG
jgi:hypothetical protein